VTVVRHPDHVAGRSSPQESVQGVRVNPEAAGEVTGGEGLVAQLVGHPKLGHRGQEPRNRMAPREVGESSSRWHGHIGQAAQGLATGHNGVDKRGRRIGHPPRYRALAATDMPSTTHARRR
jgi:hypothetical protein